MIDQNSGEADLQHVTIQPQILTGTRLLTETAQRLNRSSKTAAAQNLTIADIRKALTVTPVADTNLVELDAGGSDPTLLQRLVNTWIEVYFDARDKEVKQSTDSSSEAIRGEFHALEIGILFSNASKKGKHLIVLLLTGFTVAEAAALQKGHIHLKEHAIEVSGPNTRIIQLTEFLSTFIQDVDEFPAWHVSAIPENSNEPAALITCIAIDSGILQPEEIDAEAVRHTFLAFLIRKRLRLSEVERIAGPVPASVIASYGRFSLQGAGISIGEIDPEYPGLRDKLS